MNVASLELCKELYELSRWGDRELAKDRNGVPHYGLGYLLRKLPASQDGNQLSLDQITAGHWVAGYLYGNPVKGATEQGSSPEDAACSLAISLFKQGILTKPNQES